MYLQVRNIQIESLSLHDSDLMYLPLGTGNGLPLLDWLNKYTFNYESKFADAEYAKESYRKGIYLCIIFVLIYY